MTNCVFSFYMMSISYEITKTTRLSNELFSQYQGAAHFSADMHHIFIQACTDPKHQWFKLPYVVTKEEILAVVQQWPAKGLKDAGRKPNIPVPPVTNVGAGPSQTQQQDPPEDSDEQTESQQTESDQGGDGGNEEEKEDSVKNASDPNRTDKRKSPEVEEVTQPQSRKKTKASKDKNIVEETDLTSEELAQALSNSTETLTQKWSKFADMHLQALTGVAKHVSELKDLAEKSLTSTPASDAPVAT